MSSSLPDLTEVSPTRFWVVRTDEFQASFRAHDKLATAANQLLSHAEGMYWATRSYKPELRALPRLDVAQYLRLGALAAVGGGAWGLVQQEARARVEALILELEATQPPATPFGGQWRRFRTELRRAPFVEALAAAAARELELAAEVPEAEFPPHPRASDLLYVLRPGPITDKLRVYEDEKHLLNFLLDLAIRRYADAEPAPSSLSVELFTRVGSTPSAVAEDLDAPLSAALVAALSACRTEIELTRPPGGMVWEAHGAWKRRAPEFRLRLTSALNAGLSASFAAAASASAAAH